MASVNALEGHGPRSHTRAKSYFVSSVCPTACTSARRSAMTSSRWSAQMSLATRTSVLCRRRHHMSHPPYTKGIEWNAESREGGRGYTARLSCASRRFSRSSPTPSAYSPYRPHQRAAHARP
eukprot:3336899-Rhodomonas_salina.1